MPTLICSYPDVFKEIPTLAAVLVPETVVLEFVPLEKPPPVAEPVVEVAPSSVKE